MTATGPGPVAPAQHDHVLVVGDPAGPGVLVVLLLVALTVACAQAMLGPFVPPERGTRLAGAAAAGTAGLLVVLLADGLEFPDRVAVLVLAGLAVPLAVTVRAGTGRPVRAVQRVAPAVFVVTAAGAVAALVRGWLADPQVAGPATHTGLLVGVLGLGWLVLCRVRGRRAAAALHAVAWALAVAVLAGATGVVVTVAS